ncbi:hypothetical protein Y032_0573g174 [Ancylostoma ceylanicum]|uniref:Uncharacterized protein n=1 Tax=Ancylostoma ceylanicum TaxID=53326 RepID=A0A016WPZ0_9BILA|nr:hypothetical protein Y032_0573g174 [Ancylostoma ceylanicum]
MDRRRYQNLLGSRRGGVSKALIPNKVCFREIGRIPTYHSTGSIKNENGEISGLADRWKVRLPRRTYVPITYQRPLFDEG